ncbi:MAG: thermonuclease family protein [Cyanobacteria bacterium]|nr:thermonuclease family protein [Cyanobacteriota bacterium]
MIRSIARPLAGAIALLLTSVTLGACVGPVERTGIAATVERVPNGNTLEIQPIGTLRSPPTETGSLGLGTGDRPAPPQGRERVRLLGIDAPDLRQNPWGVQAQQALADRVAGQQVWLEFDEAPRDRFGRLLAYVWHGEVLINEQLLADGHAIVSDRTLGLKYADRLHHAQSRARLLEVGLWDPAKPLRLSPAAFRAQNP